MCHLVEMEVAEELFKILGKRKKVDRSKYSRVEKKTKPSKPTTTQALAVEAGPSNKSGKRKDLISESDEEEGEQDGPIIGSKRRKYASNYLKDEKRRQAAHQEQLKKKAGKKKRKDIKSLNSQLAEPTKSGANRGNEVVVINSEEEDRMAVQAITSSPEKPVTRARKTLASDKGIQLRIIPSRAIDSTGSSVAENPQGELIVTSENFLMS